MLPVNIFLKLMGNTVIGMELLNLLSEQEKKKKQDRQLSLFTEREEGTLPS